MPLDIVITRSHLKSKKYNAVIDGKITIPFGQKGASDYTIHKDEARKERYLKRHRANENWSNPKSAGFYSRWITWEKPSLAEAVANTNRKFKNINVKLQI